MVVGLVVWVLFAVEPGSLLVICPGRDDCAAPYRTLEECEIGRVQYEMQHVVVTFCERETR